MAITAVLYALAKAVTGNVPTPWGVGQLLIGVFVPAFFAVTSDTVSVAIGAGLGTFIGDSLFLTGSTNPALSLIAGVPANFFAFLLFGWFVKRYKSWSAFVAATVSFVTLGNFIAATSITFFGASVYSNLAGVIPKYYFGGFILGLTLFWSVTMIPIVLIVVPILIRAIRPLNGRSAIISNVPSWSEAGTRGAVIVSVLLATVLVLIVALYLPGPTGLAGYSAIVSDISLLLVGLVIILPVTGTMVISRPGRAG
jgi:hypothetical protein